MSSRSPCPGDSGTAGASIPTFEPSRPANSGQKASGAQRHDEEGAGHQAPESGEDRCHHHEFHTAMFDPRAAKRVAHDDEGRGKYQKRNGSECPGRHALLQQAETCRTLHHRLIPARKRARERKANAKREKGIQRIGRHWRTHPLTLSRPGIAWQNWAPAATTSLRKG